MNEPKHYFSPLPSIELADALYELGQRAKKDFDEPVYGEFLILQSFNYRVGKFQDDYLSVLEQLSEDDSPYEPTDEELDEVLHNINFEGQTQH